MSTPKTDIRENESDLHRDLITGEPGSHPIGTGLGAATGGATGAALGVIVGPVGAAVGAVIGALAGGLAGKGVAEVVDPTAEDAFWRTNHANQFYAGDDYTYDDYADAYRVGYQGHEDGKTFEEKEADLQLEYEGGPQKAVAEAEEESNPALKKPVGDPASIPVSVPGAPPAYDANAIFPWLMAREASRSAYERIAQGKKARSEPEN